MMDKVEIKKQNAMQKIVNHLLKDGLHDASIRKLGKAANVSDRMLIYYFGSKEALIDQALRVTAESVTDQLDETLSTHRRTGEKLLNELTIAIMEPSFQPFLQLWFEIVGLAARNKEPYARNAQLLAENWIKWIASRMEEQSSIEAIDLFAHLEGRAMLRVINVSQAG